MNDKLHFKMITYSRIFTRCDQPADVINYIQDIAKLKREDLDIEEINILFRAIHELIKKTRKSWEIICSIESNEIKKKSKFRKVVKDAKEEVFKEMEEYAIVGHGLIDRYLMRNVKSPSLEALYLMQKGDLDRLMISFTFKDEDNKQVIDLQDKAGICYEKAFEICKILDDLSSIKAGIILHYAVFLYEEKKDVSKAYKIANDFYQNSDGLLKNVKNRSTFSDLIRILSIIKQNIDVWSIKINSNVENDESKDKK